MRALLSVYHKDGIIPLAQACVGADMEVVSTGGTYQALVAEGLPVTKVSDLTQYPEILDGRVKTLHPVIHGGLLADLTNEAHQATLKEQGIEPIGLIAVNLYPFAETVKRPNVSLEEIIENIDIGGVALLRAAAKNGEQVAVVSDPKDYAQVSQELADQGEVSLATRRKLQAKAFRYTAAYDALIAEVFTERLQAHEEEAAFPERLTLTYERQDDLRYGENPQQRAAVYREVLHGSEGTPDLKQWHGKALSYNNWQDVDAALQLMREFDQTTAIALKHTNPCGVGQGESIEEAFKACRAADPVSIFGGIVIVNETVTKALAEDLNDLFLEIIIAPAYEDEAMTILTQKKNIRLLETLAMEKEAAEAFTGRFLDGGLLRQDVDLGLYQEEPQVVTKRQPTTAERQALDFAWRVVKHVKSNAIVLACKQQTLGIGAGQMNRVGALEIAIKEAQARGFALDEAVLASDAFFPMPDCLQLAAQVGIKAVIQPGGSIKDAASTEVADQYDIAMLHTHQRHFKH